MVQKLREVVAKVGFFEHITMRRKEMEIIILLIKYAHMQSSILNTK